jgi:hypothetical protein
MVPLPILITLHPPIAEAQTALIYHWNPSPVITAFYEQASPNKDDCGLFIDQT